MLEVSSAPAGARIIIDGRPTGFRTPTIFPLQAGEHRVTLSLSGHRNAEKPVRLGPGDTLRVEATLTPIAAGSLGVASIPEGALILLDGVSVDLLTPAVIPQLAVGTHTVQLQRDGSEDWSQAVVITQNRTLEIQARLTPSRHSLGMLAVQSQPSRAAISLDGHPTGKLTPDRLTGVAPGSHRVELALEGFRPWSGPAVIRAGHTENLLVTLRRLPAQEVCSARVETDPPGASLTLNGVVLRQKSPANLTRLAPGTYSLEITRPGSRPWKGGLTAQPGKPALVQVHLEPEALYSGSIRVTSEPPEAGVRLDGQQTGFLTPVLLPNLAPSGHRVEVTLPGFRPWARVVHVGEGKLEHVQARLIPHPYTITISVAAAHDGELDLALTATGPDNAPAAGVLELGVSAAAGTLRESRVVLAGGRARALLKLAPEALEVTVSAELGTQRDVFVLRRADDGWESIPFD